MRPLLPLVALGACFVLSSSGAQRGALINVPEASNYALVYSLDIPNNPNFSGGVAYDIDLHDYWSDFNRIGYYLELQKNGGDLNYVWVSMDAFTSDIGQVGVPTLTSLSGGIFQQPVTSMNVLSSVAGIVTGANLDGGNIEFWPYNYGQANSAGVPNASDALFDWGDTPGSSGAYGCMQIANGVAGQQLFCFNNWNGGNNADLGIGSNPDPGGQPDWTFAGNGASYIIKTLQVFVRPVSNTNAPALVGASGLTGLTNIVVRFSKALEDAATNASHYTLGGGVTVLGATLDITRTIATLVTTPQQPLTTYTLSVTGVRDWTSAHLTIAANSTTSFRSSIAGRGASRNVTEAAGYTLVYSLDIPDSPNYQNGVSYNIDQRANVSGFSRIAYYLELQKAGGLLNYIWVSMDAFTNNINAIGVPTVPTGTTFQLFVTNMNVASSLPDIVSGANIQGGNLEFWSGNYVSANGATIANASDTLFDWGDSPSAGNYGSMQIANPEASQELLCFNRWGGAGGFVDLGIGNNPNPGSNPDWTFAQNSASYVVKTLQVYVVPIFDTNRPTIMSAVGVGNFTQVVLTFSKPLDDSATNVGHYALSGGLVVVDASLDQLTKTTVTLTTTAQQPRAAYTVTVNGVFERSGFHTPIAPNSTIGFAASAARGARFNVAEAGNYALVYSLDIPLSPNYGGGIDYNLDLHNYLGEFSRIGYYLELQATNGPLQYVWVSMDAFTSDLTQIGVPTAGSLNGSIWQQPVSSMNVTSSVPGIVSGNNLDGGNLEFWPYNYAEPNAGGVPNASETAFDWGDSPATGGNYGSMQIANALASQELLCFNGWGGGSGIACLGIGNNVSGSPDWTFAQNAGSFAVKTLQVFVLPSANTNLPVLVGGQGQTGLTNVVLTFSKALEEAATNTSHYALNGGVGVLKAELDPLTRLTVRLTTTAQQPLTTYTVTVNGVRDGTAAHLAVAPNSTAVFRSSIVGRGAANNVAEAGAYTLVYSLEVPVAANYFSGIAYNVDQSASISSFSRIAYYVELQEQGKALNYLWASMAAFTNNVQAIGVPTLASGAVYQQAVSELHVASSVAEIVTGTNLTGTLEFWPYNYDRGNGAGVANASADLYDWGDTLNRGGYHGSMQLANAAASQELFCFNNWGGGGGTAALGIGNNPQAGGNPDWTFAANADIYTVKTIQVYVLGNAKSFRISGERFQGPGQFAVTAETQPGTTYSLWRTLSVIPNWTKVASATATGASTTLVDPQATNSTAFYQVRAVP